MKSTTLTLALALAAACSLLTAQTTPAANQLQLPPTMLNPRVKAAVPYRNRTKLLPPKPFSVVAVSGGVSAMGINMQAAVNVNRYMNLRGTGNYFSYTTNNISTNGFNVAGTFSFDTAAASVDFFPFPHHGFRVSPGVMFRNYNQVSATVVARGGTSFTLNNANYYSAAAAPVSGTASMGLNKQNPTLTATLGWGNMIPRYGGGHWSFPVEIGAAFIGQPAVNMVLSSGQVCTDPQGTQNCTNVVGNPDVNTNLAGEIARISSDVKPFQYYPILSWGVAYNFHIRHTGQE